MSPHSNGKAAPADDIKQNIIPTMQILFQLPAIKGKSWQFNTQNGNAESTWVKALYQVELVLLHCTLLTLYGKGL